MHIKLTGLFVSCALTVMSQTGIKEIDNNATTQQPAYEQVYDQRLQEFNKKSKSLDDCFSFVDGPLTFHDSVYISRLHSLPTEMNLKFNPIVREHIEKYTKNTQNQVSNLLEKSQYYFPLFEEILDREGVPLELKYLPVVESALNPTVRSHAGAAGIWQFMLVTGKSYGLEVNSLVDERRDPIKSTTAAAKYLKDLYYIYDDWSLVLAAYNCGPANVNKAIYRSGGKTDYWDIYPYLPKETRNYVPAFIAATYIMNFHNEHNICPAKSNFPISMDSVKIKKNIRLQHVANVINIPLNDLKRYNPQFKSDVIPGNDREYTLNLPAQNILAFIDNEDAIYSNKKPKKTVNTKQLFAQNTIAKEESPVISPETEDELNPLLEAREVTIIHKVVKGDNLIKIAKRNDITVAELKKWNNLKKNYIRPGTELKIQKIEYFAVEPKLKEPELMTVSIDPNSNFAVIENYLQQIEREKDVQRSMDNIRTSDELRLVAATNNYNYKAIAYTAKKGNANIFNRIANITTTTFHTVKGWGETQLGKLKGERPIEYYAENVALAQIQPDIKEESVAPVTSVIELAPKVQRSLYTSVVDDKNETSYTVFNDNTRSKVYHKVKIGETITQIATYYKVSKDDIIAWNNLTFGMAKISQRLLIYLPNNDDLANVPL